MSKKIKWHIPCVVCLCLFSCKQNVSHDEAVNMMMNHLMLCENFNVSPYQPLKDLHGSNCRIDSLILKGSVLFFRFSQQNCEDCIRKEIELIKESGIQDYVIGMASYDNLRMLIGAIRKYNISFPVYFITYNDASLMFPSPIEEVGRPFLFLIGSDFKAKYVYMPEKNMPDLSVSYYKQLLKIISGEDSENNIFEFRMMDIGEVRKGELQKIEYKCTNRKNELLSIKNIESSCDCTVPHWDTRALKKYESSKLVVFFTPDQLGYNVKSVLVYHNQSDVPVLLLFKANVVE